MVVLLLLGTIHAKRAFVGTQVCPADVFSFSLNVALPIGRMTNAKGKSNGELYAVSSCDHTFYLGEQVEKVLCYANRKTTTGVRYTRYLVQWVGYTKVPFFLLPPSTYLFHFDCGA